MNSEAIQGLKEDIKANHLVYVNSSAPGLRRIKKGRGFVYLNSKNERVIEEELLERIRSLAIPPAWTNVWICSQNNGHLQATGLDKAGRKQYIYHSLWSIVRNETKHNHMHQFGLELPKLRRRITADLRQKELSKGKIVALAVSILDHTGIRVGNSFYTEHYGSYGLTSLRGKHLKINGNTLKISFVGKKGVMQQIELTHPILVRLVKKVSEIPGRELFQYYDQEGIPKPIDSTDINLYLHEAMGNDFTAKDFRTWWGTLSVATFLARLEPFNSVTKAQKNVNDALDFGSKKLGNTRSVCKKYYVHPALLEHYMSGELENYLRRIREVKGHSKNGLLTAEEKIMIEFLRKLIK